ncbi:MAG: SMI1/KNR4 family protein [Pyrinomonadaceae bacterium]
MNEIETFVLEKVDSVRFRGEKTLENGTRLVSPAPEIAPQAWHFVLFAPLSLLVIDEIEKELSTSLPVDLRDFFRTWNGAKLFGYKMQVWGHRSNYVRVGDEAWQPFDLVALNRASERPVGSPRSSVFFGSLCDDWVFFERNEDGNTRIGRTAREFFQPEEYWPSFNAWFKQSFDKSWDLSEVT